MSKIWHQLFSDGNARVGELCLPRLPGLKIKTPVFMPVGTRASVKSLTQEQLEEIGFDLILANTYHLYLRPGHELIKKLGGLHQFMSWNKLILTDSGGFQVFSLAHLNSKNQNGVRFQSHIDGSYHEFTPEKSMEIQRALGSDIVMCFDDCPKLPASKAELIKSLELTYDWAKRSRAFPLQEHQRLFGIIQGGLDLELRKQCLDYMLSLNFPGLALGGLSVGEKNEEMRTFLENFVPSMPPELPRYLMGVGGPLDVLHAISTGVDMFDCVLPTRNARNGQALTSTGPVNIKNARYQEDTGPLDANCSCSVCQRYSRAYLRHLFLVGEYSVATYLTIHNLHFMKGLVEGAQKAIENGQFSVYYQRVTSAYQGSSTSGLSD